MNILAVHDGHNGSVALLQQGKITYALSEERLARVKNQGGFPSRAFERILGEAGVDARELDRVVLCNSSPLRPEWIHRDRITARYRQYCTAIPGAVGRFRKKAVDAMPKSLLSGLRKALQPETQKSMNELGRDRIAPLLAAGIPEERVDRLDHHLCHAAGAYYGLGEFDKPVLCLTCDGGGDGNCASVWIGRGGRLERLDSIPVGDSVAKLYALITFMMGLAPLDHEYKVMGLAPYAEVDKGEEVAAYLAKHFEWREEDTRWKRRSGLPTTSYWHDIIQRKIRFQRFDVIASGFQMFVERMMVRWVKAWIQRSGVHRIALSGGIFMNVKLNKMLMELNEVESIFVLPSCGDESNPIGAAYLGALAVGQDHRTFSPLKDLYLGPIYSKETIEKAVLEFGKRFPVKIETPDRMDLRVAQLLAEGQIVARYQGREEFGARALGNRSILADPSRLDIIREINKMIKCRDFWMPFAGTMTVDQAERNLLNPKKVKAPYMIMAFSSRDHYEEYHAATHPYDGTMRPQILEEEWNPGYYKILKMFETLSGKKGGLLNTSFKSAWIPDCEFSRGRVGCVCEVRAGTHVHWRFSHFKDHPILIPMYVLIVASKYPPEHSGSGKRLHELYKRLVLSKFSVKWQVLSTRSRDCGTGWLEGIHVHRVPGARDSKRLSPKSVSRLVEVLLGIREAIASLMYLERVGHCRVQVIHTCGWSWCVIAACLWGYWNGVPVIRELTSMTDHPFSPSWMRPIIRATLKSAVAIVAISPFLEQKCLSAGLGAKVWCRPNPVDEKRFMPVSPKEKISIRKRLFPEVDSESTIWLTNFGKIRPLKNQLQLIHVLSRLPDAYRLIVAGPIDPSDQSYLDRIYQAIDRFGLEKRVLIRLGNHRDPEKYMQASDIFLFPSTSEGLGTVVLEALMCGLPVVSSRIGGVTDTVINDGENGYLVDFSGEGVAEVIQKARLLTEKRDRIAEGARSKFAAEVIDDQYRQLLHRISRAKSISVWSRSQTRV